MTATDQTIRTQLVALTRELQRAQQKVSEVAQTATAAKDDAASANRGVSRLAEELVKLVRDAEQAGGPDGDDEEQVKKAPPGLTWLTVTNPDDAYDQIDGLADWLGTVYSRWQDKQLPDCWAWHPAVVAELLALRDAWHAAISPEGGSSSKQMDWVDRYRPGTARRIERETKDCSLDQHTHDKPTAYRPPRVDGADMLAELTEWWVNSGGRSAAPAPTPDMLAAARARQVEED